MQGISVIIPYHNGCLARLEATLDSVNTQTNPPDEIIVVNDGSDPAHTAGLMAAARTHQLVVVHQSNSGPAAARNLGAEAARGAWLAFLDADDLWHPTKLARQLALAMAMEHTGKLILTHAQTVRPDGHCLREVRFDATGDAGAQITQVLGGGGNIHSFTSTLFLARDVFAEIGGFDPALWHREDQHFLIKALRRLGVAVVPDILSSRVVHPESYSARTRGVRASELMRRQTRFAQAIAAEVPGFHTRRFLAREAVRIGKHKAADRATVEAIAMGMRAIALRPLAVKGWILPAAAVAGLFAPGLIRAWRRDPAWG